MKQLKIASVPSKRFSIALSNLIARCIFQLRMIIIALLLGSCSDLQTIVISQQDGAGQPVNINTISDAVPKIEPITRAGNKSPYTQFGETYYVMRSSKGYREIGIASWYGSKFHGRRTSNGEIYNMYGMTAAHKTLPIPTYVRVTNHENRRSIIVRVNDRGPFHDARIIDLSYVAALKLGFARKGTTKVSVEAIDPSTGSVWSAVAATKTTQDSTSSDSGHYLQAGAYKNHQSAKRLANQILQALSVPVIIKESDEIFKVWVGPFAHDEELRTNKERLKQYINVKSFTVKQ